MKDGHYTKTFILSIVNLVLEVIITLLTFNSIITSIFNVPDISLLQSIGLVFAVSWVKLDVKKQADKSELDDIIVKRTVYYAVYLIVAIIIYLIKRFCFG